MESQHAKVKIVLMNRITTNVHVEKIGTQFLLWFEMVYGRDEYDEFGMGKDWDEVKAICEETQKSPWTYKNLKTINNRIEELNKYHDGTGFKMELGRLVPAKAGA